MCAMCTFNVKEIIIHVHNYKLYPIDCNCNNDFDLILASQSVELSYSNNVRALKPFKKFGEFRDGDLLTTI